MGPVDQALVLAGMGHCVFPCNAQKKPCVPAKETENGPRWGATRDAARIMELWRLWPGALVGLACGVRSNLAVLDADTTRHAEAEAWLAQHHHRLPGRSFVTRSGGVHLWFRWKLDVVNCARRPVPGIDARGEGGYVIWWGEDNVGRASLQGLAEWPEWLRLAIWPPPKPRPAAAARRKPDGDTLVALMQRLESAEHGERNWELYKVACCAARDVKRGYFGAQEAVAELTASARSIFEAHEWPEIEPTIRSAFRAEGI